MKQDKLNVISLCSGAMGLDLGLEKAGFTTRLCVEIEHDMAETIRANRPSLPVVEDDMRNYSGDDLLTKAGMKRDELFLLCGGPPCQAFSTAGRRRGLDDDRGNVFLKFIDLIEDLQPKYFLIENVRGLLSASYTPPETDKTFGYPPATPKEQKGTALLFILSRIRKLNYSLTFTLYDASNYGVPQNRERVIILGSRDGMQIPLIPPTHSEKQEGKLKAKLSFRDAVAGIQKHTHGVFPEKRLRFYRMLKQGQYWKDLPKELHAEAMGASLHLGGGKTGFYRRLAWDKPSPTLVTCPTMPATDLCHPVEDRPLSIQEYARVQMFPDDWVFCGNKASIYKQIGNAVPVGMGEAVGRHILWFDSLSIHEKRKLTIVDPHVRYSRYRNTDHLYFAELLHRLSSVEKQEALAL